VTGHEGLPFELPDDPDLRALVLRARRAWEDHVPAPAVTEPVPEGDAYALPAGRPASRLRSDRACVETNLARKGLWRAGRALGDINDAMGIVQRIDTGRPLGALAFDIIVWVCSRWRELDDPRARAVPFTLTGLADDLGWGRGGGACVDLADAVDALTQATFRARVFNAAVREVRIDTFGLVDRWERGERDRPERRSQAGFLVLGDWLLQQLRAGNVTYVSWSQMRALRAQTSRRLLIFLEAERFRGRWRRVIDPALLASLGIEAGRTGHRLATLRRAAEEVTRAENRYTWIGVEDGERRGERVLVVRRREPATAPPTRAVGATRTRAVGASDEPSNIFGQLRRSQDLSRAEFGGNRHDNQLKALRPRRGTTEG